MRRTINVDKNEKNSAFAKEKTLNQKKDNQNLADKYQNNNVILNKETFNMIREQGNIGDEGAKFSYIQDNSNFYANNNDDFHFIKKESPKNNNPYLDNKRYGSNGYYSKNNSEKESFESYDPQNSRKKQTLNRSYFETIQNSDTYDIIKKKEAEHKKFGMIMENQNLFIERFGEKIEQNLNKFAEAIRGDIQNSINAQRQENKNFVNELLVAQR